jgi:hypothetical protein
MKRSMISSLICAAGLFTACSGGTGTGSDCNTLTTGAEGKNVANALTVPQEKSQYAMDLNGDNKLDNQLGNIIGALTAQNLDPQTGVNDSIKAGGVILLLDETASDLTNSTCGAVKVEVGTAAKDAMGKTIPPKYDGTDAFTVDTTIGGGSFKGVISNGAYNSNSPVSATDATQVVVNVQLPLVAGSAPITLKVNGGHIQFTRMGDGLMKGQLNGAIKSSDVQMTIIPAVAKLLSDKVASGSGMMSTNQQILDIFDTGGQDCSMTNPCTGQPNPTTASGCMNTDGTPSCKNYTGPDAGMCAKKGDKIISTCEVATNSIIKNVLAPDVQMFSDDGTHYMPSAANMHKDSLSLGLAFTAVKASF